MAEKNRAKTLAWWRDAPLPARRALVAAALGWMLDAFDVMLYAMVIATLMPALGIGKGVAGLLGSITLAASAVGGMIFGHLADRFGRTRALIASILIYSIFTALCGLAQSALQLAVFRVFLGLGMGGEWASGAALVAETWPASHRGKALGLMQSFWAVGYAAAAATTALVLPQWGWRAVFFVGVLPALFTLWIRRRVEEPRIWQESRLRTFGETAPAPAGFWQLIRRNFLALTVVLTAMNACTMFAWWGFNLWLPAFLSLPHSQGGIGLAPRTMSGFIITMQVGMWFGYISFGFISDRLGRKKTYVVFLLSASFLLSLYAAVRQPWLLLLLGPPVAFFGTGYFSGFGAISAELYPTAIRATAQGFTYNFGRLASAFAPLAVGSLAQKRGFAAAFMTTAAAFLVAALLWHWIPETRLKKLE